MDTSMTAEATTATGEQAEFPYSHEELKEAVDEFVDATQDARALSERCRDYFDGKQWTAERVAVLKRRKQAPIVNNRVKVKQNGLLGLVSLRKGDPKAFPRNEGTDSKAADAVTDGLVYAADKTNLNNVFSDAADNFFCEGYCGVHVIGEMKPNGDIEVLCDHIPWERIFFDAYSTKADFSDTKSKRGRGFMLWMDEEAIREAFHETPPEVLEQALSEPQLDDTTFDDKPSWWAKSGKARRFLIATHYVYCKGEWYLTIYTGSGYLLEPRPSPYLDEYGQTECPLELEHAYIDRDGNRYGELASSLDLQDEINHRRSKALFLLSQRQTYGNKGALKDIKKAKRELAKADGHLEVGVGEFGKDFGILPTGDMADGQLQLLQEAKAEIDAQSYNAQMAGDRQQGDLSGVAIQRLQQSGVTELNRLFDRFGNLKLRVYRQMWNRIRQYWTQEKWVRVTDDDKKPRYAGFNVSMTLQESLQEIMDDESKPYPMRVGASAQMIMLEQSNPEALQQIVEVKNKPTELDMDIILDENYDTVNASQEQLDAILKFGAQNAFDIVDLLEISNVRGKDRLIEKIEKRKKEASEGQQQNPELLYMQAKAQEAAASAKVKEQDAAQTAIENQILQTTPQPIPFKGSVSA